MGCFPKGSLSTCSSNDGLVLDGAKPLAVPKLIHHQYVLLRTIQRNYLKYQSLKCVWKIKHLKSQPHLPSDNQLNIKDRVTWYTFREVSINQFKVIWVTEVLTCCYVFSTILNSPPPPLDKMATILADDISKCIFINEKFSMWIQISQKFVPKGPIDNKSALVQIMAWRRTGDKPLPELRLT